MDLSEKETRILSSVFVGLTKKPWLTKLHSHTATSPTFNPAALSSWLLCVSLSNYDEVWQLQ